MEVPDTREAMARIDAEVMASIEEAIQNGDGREILSNFAELGPKLQATVKMRGADSTEGMVATLALHGLMHLGAMVENRLRTWEEGAE